MSAHTACVNAHVEVRRQLGRVGFSFHCVSSGNQSQGSGLLASAFTCSDILLAPPYFFETGSIAKPGAPRLSYNSWLVTLIQGILLPLPSQSCAETIVCAQVSDWFSMWHWRSEVKFSCFKQWSGCPRSLLIPLSPYFMHDRVTQTC